MLGNIILALAEAVDLYPREISKIITVIASLITGIHWIVTGGKIDVFSVLAFLCCILFFRIVVTCQVYLLKLICHIGLAIYFYRKRMHEFEHQRKEQYSYEYEQEQKQQQYYQQQWKRTENKNSQNTGGQHTYSTAQDSSYMEAVRYFGLSFPFTEADLKTSYRNAMKKAHPDAGGSTEEAEKVNRYYSLLKGMCQE